MAAFRLQIVTMYGLSFDGEAERVIVRTAEGDVGILRGHADYVAPLGIGKARITVSDGTERIAACAGGFVSVTNKETRIVASTFEWAEEIDTARAQRAKARAEALLKQQLAKRELALAEAKLKRALTRLEAASGR